MDPIKAEKIQAMNSYKQRHFLHNLIVHALIAITCLLCSYPYWFPSLCFSMNHFLFVSLQNISAFFVNPKCMFIVVNVIVVFLVGESKLAGSNSSPANGLYDEYVERSHSLRRHSSAHQERKEEKNSETDGESSNGNHGLDGDSEFLVQKEENFIEDGVDGAEGTEVSKAEGEEVGKAEGEGEHEEDGEEAGLPAEELNKRVEEFIARVNKQLQLEAKLSAC